MVRRGGWCERSKFGLLARRISIVLHSPGSEASCQYRALTFCARAVGQPTLVLFGARQDLPSDRHSNLISLKLQLSGLFFWQSL